MTTFDTAWVGAVSAGRAGVPRCQAPNACSASGRSSLMVMSPATINAALFGTKFCCQNARRRSPVMAFNDASLPISANPYGCVSPSDTAATTVDATACALARCCASCPSRTVRCRSSSSAANEGCSATSATCASAAAKLFLSVRVLIVDASMVLVAVRVPPSCAMSSAICSAVRVVVPWVSIADAKFASPGASAGLLSLPVLITRLAATTGRPRRGASITVSPLASVIDSGVGTCI